MQGVFIPLTHLLSWAWVSIPASLCCRFNWAVKLLKGKMRNYPVFHGRQWAGLPELRWPTLTTPRSRDNCKPLDQDAGACGTHQIHARLPCSSEARRLT